MRLIKNDCCLAVIEHQDSLHVYLETVNGLSASIASEKPVKKFFLEKMGKECLFAVDEGKRLMVVLSMSKESPLSLH